MEDHNMQGHQVVLEKIANLHSLLVRVEKKVDKTNGRVLKGEKRWAYLSGAVAILTTLILPVLFLILSKNI